MKTVENMKFNFTPSGFDVKESTDGTWLHLGGTALTECKSKNKNRYRFENLLENDGKNFKWLVGHPHEPERHVVGNGVLKLENNELLHEGKIRNTAEYPDLIEKVKDKFYGPSIHASAKKVTYNEENDEYKMEGLSIDGVGLVAFQGVEDASIDYAIAESFEKLADEKDKTEIKNKDIGENIMTDEIKNEELIQQKDEAVAKLEAVQNELKLLKEQKKDELVSKIIETNDKLDKETLMAEDESKLNLILEYEMKLKPTESITEASVVEDEEETDDEDKETVVEKDGSLTMSAESYSQFNKELVDRIR